MLIAKVKFLLLIKIESLPDIDGMQNHVEPNETHLFKLIFFLWTLDYENNDVEKFAQTFEN